jgi:hypothetical protein
MDKNYQLCQSVHVLSLPLVSFLGPATMMDWARSAAAIKRCDEQRPRGKQQK